MKSRQKSPKKFHCKYCLYTSRNKYDFKKHLSTAKHKMITNDNKMGNKNDNKVLKYVCEFCNRGYKYPSGLSRHRKKCNTSNENAALKKSRQSRQEETQEQNMVMSTANDSVRILTEVLSKQGDLIEKLIKNQNEMIPKLGNNNNNKISVNVFLNNHCKNAMNLTDFVENIKVSLEDLEYTNQHGYVKGISNIFTRHLTDMKVTERPIHCSDKKRLQFYVKDSDKWEKDKSNVKIDKTIQKITKKQILKIKEWELQNPDYLDKEELTQEWHKMIFNMTGGEKDSDRAKNTTHIKKHISENVIVKELIKND
jgi:hypothetical protein